MRLYFLFLLLALPLCGRAQSIALSFDDGLNPDTQSDAAKWNAAILDALSKAGIKSILFAAGSRVDSPAGLQLVKDWGKRGHAIGNHTYAHLNFNSAKLSLDAFISDVEKNEALLKNEPGWVPRLRFPYLKEGDTAEKRDGVRSWITKHGYQSGEVSIDASDWYYSNRYTSWRQTHPKADLASFRAAYLDHLWSRATYYDSLSQRLLHRSAKHVMLLHTNQINAEFMPDVIAMFISKGWKFVSPIEAYSDPLYRMTPNVLPAGESILWALAKQNGVAGLRYPAEDDVYEKPILDRLGL